MHFSKETDHKPLKSPDSRKKGHFDFIAFGLDFVAPDFDFVAPGFEFVASGLDFHSPGAPL